MVRLWPVEQLIVVESGKIGMISQQLIDDMVMVKIKYGKNGDGKHQLWIECEWLTTKINNIVMGIYMYENLKNALFSKSFS